MTPEPLVSVIVPFFKQEEYLAETLNSVASQTYRNFEIVIVDDGSPGRSAQEIVDELGMSRIKVVRHSENRGLASARNTAFAHSRGDLIVPLDSDDLLDADFLKITVKAVLDEDCAGVYTGLAVFGEQNCIAQQNCDLIRLLAGIPCGCTFLYKRELYEAVGGYRTELAVGEDLDFWIRVVSQRWPIKYIDKPLVHYRKHSGGLSARCDENGPPVMRLFARYHKALYVEHLEEVLYLKEKIYRGERAQTKELYREWRNCRDNYQELYREWERTAENYHKLYKEWEAADHNCRALQAELQRLSDSTPRSGTQLLAAGAKELLRRSPIAPLIRQLLRATRRRAQSAGNLQGL